MKLSYVEVMAQSLEQVAGMRETLISTSRVLASPSFTQVRIGMRETLISTSRVLARGQPLLYTGQTTSAHDIL